MAPLVSASPPFLSSSLHPTSSARWPGRVSRRAHALDHPRHVYSPAITAASSARGLRLLEPGTLETDRAETVVHDPPLPRAVIAAEILAPAPGTHAQIPLRPLIGPAHLPEPYLSTPSPLPHPGHPAALLHHAGHPCAAVAMPHHRAIAPANPHSSFAVGPGNSQSQPSSS